MKRYGDNLPSKCEDEIVNDRGGAVQVIRGSCAVRYDMLDFILNTEPPKKQKTSSFFSFLKLGRKKNNEDNG